jgi:hypothetical protein
MSKKENIQEEEIKETENNTQVDENQDVEVSEPTSEDLILLHIILLRVNGL